MKQILLMIGMVALVGCGEEATPSLGSSTDPAPKPQPPAKSKATPKAGAKGGATVKADAFIGKWSEFGETVEGNPETWEFHKDGTVEIIDEGNAGTFKYEGVDADTVLIDTPFGKIIAKISKSGDEITGAVGGVERWKYRRKTSEDKKEN